VAVNSLRSGSERFYLTTDGVRLEGSCRKDCPKDHRSHGRPSPAAAQRSLCLSNPRRRFCRSEDVGRLDDRTGNCPEVNETILLPDIRVHHREHGYRLTEFSMSVAAKTFKTLMPFFAVPGDFMPCGSTLMTGDAGQATVSGAHDGGKQWASWNLPRPVLPPSMTRRGRTTSAAASRTMVPGADPSQVLTRGVFNSTGHRVGRRFEHWLPRTLRSATHVSRRPTRSISCQSQGYSSACTEVEATPAGMQPLPSTRT
jgi:hypothetical protein